jgi:hypothetical protein
MKASHLIWIGAGNAALPFFEFDDFEKISLVDARQIALDRLQIKFKDYQNIDFVNALISDGGENETFYNVKPEWLSQVGDIDSVKDLYPNLSIVSKIEMDVTSLSELFRIIDVGQHEVTMVFDLPNLNHYLVRQLVSRSKQFNIKSLYVLDGDNVFEELSTVFTPVGRIKGDISGQYLHYFRDPLVESLEKELSQLKINSDKRVETLELQLEKSRNELMANLAASNQLQQKEFSFIEEKLKAISDAVLPLRNGLVQNSFKDLEEKLPAYQSDLKKTLALEAERILVALDQDAKTHPLKELESSLTTLLSKKAEAADEKLVTLTNEVKRLSEHQLALTENSSDKETARVLRNIPFLLQKNSYNTSKQVESFISLNKYINQHEIPLSFHGWPISPDIGLTLVNYIENEDVDIVLEFGSGTSSVLFARAFRLANPEQSLWTIEKPIISFEHNEEYLEKTSRLLMSHGCRDVVNLTHAPLVDFEYIEQGKFLYYDCEEVIKDLSKALGENKKNLLILIDGPPGVTNKNARFPALPILLNHMSKHRLIVVMDDYDRDDEKDTFKLWEELADRRYLTHKSQVIETEKGLSILTIN